MVAPLPASFRSEPGTTEFDLMRRLRQPIEKVWAALTTPQRLADWMGVDWLASDGPLTQGAEFSYRFHNTDMETRGRVLRFEPPYVLEHSWFDNVPPGAVVRWALEPDGDGCRLTLIHRFGQPDDAPRTAAGWTALMESLAVSLGEPDAAPPAGKDDWRRLRDAYAETFPQAALRDGRQTQVDGATILRFERLIARPAAVVWEALTTPEGLARWMQSDAQVEPRQGGRFHLAFHGGEHVMDGEVTCWAPPSVLEYTWPEAQAGGDSLVRFELSPKGAGCRLVLIHTLKAGGDLADFASGWHWHLDALDGAVDGVARTFDKLRWESLRTMYRATL